MTEPMAMVVIQRIQKTHSWLLTVTGDLPEGGLAQRFSVTAPPIGWHLWHIARWADRLQASFPNRPFEAARRWDPARQIWFRERIGDRWGLDANALGILQTGATMTYEAAAAVPARVPGQVLHTYARQAFEAVDATVLNLDAARLIETRNSILELTRNEQGESSEAAGPETTVSADLAFHLSHASRHLGCMEALRGLLDIPGSATM